MGGTGDGQERDAVMAALLPPAVEVMTAWSLAEDGEPAEFTEAMHRVVGDIAAAEDPRREMARFLFAMASLSGILLDRIAVEHRVGRHQVLQAVRRQYIDRPPADGHPSAA